MTIIQTPPLPTPALSPPAWPKPVSGARSTPLRGGKGPLRGEETRHTSLAKIERLPKATRDMINLMLDDGLPYRVIVDELADTGRGLTPQSLTRWLKSDYEDYLKNRESSGYWALVIHW